MSEGIDRRRFLARAAAAAAGAGLLALDPGGLSGLAARSVLATRATGHRLYAGLGGGGYGPIVPAGKELALPRDFTYRVLGVEGSPMSDGRPTPRAHDGMAAFPLPNGNIRLIRNHEDRSGPATPICDPDAAYDVRGAGGTTSLEVEPDGERRLVWDGVTLGGTIYNCAGGPTSWGSWLSCEEAVGGSEYGWDRAHGYVYEVPAAAVGPVEAIPLKAMGRFVHEAVALDPSSGIVYLTEDMHRAGFYRFLPEHAGDLRVGGRLQILAIDGRPNFDTSRGQTVGTPMPVGWIEIPDPDPTDAARNPSAVFQQGWRRGAARFRRLEGCYFGGGRVFIDATDGGDARKGQVWNYDPLEETITLFFESPGADVLDGPDNLCTSARGGLIICEDGADGNYLRGLTPDGRIFDFARNLVNKREFAGATFSPDGRTLFVNIQGDLTPGGPGNRGMTLAIWGPWEEGVL